MKVLFLDVDGVLNDNRMRDGLYTIEQKPLNTLAMVVARTQCDVVISSAWRLYPDALKVLREKLLTVGIRDIGVTPNLFKGPRGLEINAWLSDKGLFNIESYVILDDNDDGLSTYHGTRFVKTNPNVGFSMDNALEAIRVLQNPLLTPEPGSISVDSSDGVDAQPGAVID